MAIQDGIIKVKGSIDDTVGYEVEGQHRLRKKARRVRRSEATKRSATDFGTASKAGKLVRRAVKQVLDIRTDNKLTNRMNTALLPILYAGSADQGARSFQPEELSLLTGFRFNKQTDIGRLLPCTIRVVQQKGHLRIALPALTAKNFRCGSNTSHIEVKAIAVGVNFNQGNYGEAVSDKVLYDFRQPAEAKELVLPFEAGEDETIVVLQITAFSEWNGKMYRLSNMKYCAADIIDVIPSLPAEEEQKPVHHVQIARQPLFQLHGDHSFAIPQRE